MRRFIYLLTFALPFLFSSYCYASTITTSTDTHQITADTQVSINTLLSISSQDGTGYFLRGVFFKPGTNDYCGYTWNGNDFFSGPYSTNNGWKSFYPVTLVNSSWSGTLRVKINPQDSGCSQSGTYSFKIQRFTSLGSATFDPQGELSFDVVIPTPTPSPTVTPAPVNKTEVKNLTPTMPAKNNTPTPLQPTQAPLESPVIPPASTSAQLLSEAASTEAQPEATLEAKEEIAGASIKKNNNTWIILFLGFSILTAACGILLFQKYKGGIKDQKL